MRIGYDAKRITHNKTGLGNYGRFIVKGLASSFPDNDYYLYSINSGNKHLYEQLRNCTSIRFRYPERKLEHLFPALWRSHHILRDLKQDKVDVFHGLSNELPFGIRRSNIPSVVTVHDLIFLRYPDLYPPIDRCIYTYKFKKACLEADLVIAASQQTKADIIDCWKIKEEKIEVVYQGCDASFYQPATEAQKQEVRAKYSLSAPYILYVGSIEERKNLLTLVKAFEQLNDKTVKLIAIGRRTAYLKKVETYIQERHLQSRVGIFTSISSPDLPALYQMAELFAYPSFHEGFGIPVLEALVSNTPVIAATGSCLEETGGTGSLYADPDDVHQLKSLIESVLGTPSLAAKMRSEGKIHSQRFSAGALSQQLMTLYRGLM
ncbi:glycosyl transferase family 1 [Bacteroidia bacterium]|nr:glycosyl transferase family 1 [Bacteroidia bacterium]